MTRAMACIEIKYGARDGIVATAKSNKSVSIDGLAGGRMGLEDDVFAFGIRSEERFKQVLHLNISH